MIRALLVFLCLGTQAFAAYGYHRSLTNATPPASTLTNFTFMLSGTVSEFKTVGNGGHVQHTVSQTVNGHSLTVPADFVVSPNTDGSSPIPFFFEAYNSSTGAFVLKAKYTLTTGGVVLHAVYGDSGVSTFQGNITGSFDANTQGFWPMGDGTTLYPDDYTSHVNHCTTHSMGTVSAAAGKIDGGLGISNPVSMGSNNFLDCGTDASLQQSAFTVSAWVYVSDNSSQQAIISGSVNNSPTFAVTNTQTLRIIRAGVVNLCTSSSAISLDTWTHVAATYNPTGGSNADCKFFIDGSSAGTAMTSSHFWAFGTFYIGGSDTGVIPWNGTLDNVTFASSIRSDDWIAFLAASENAPGSYWTIGSEVGAGGSTSRRAIIIQ